MGLIGGEREDEIKAALGQFKKRPKFLERQTVGERPTNGQTDKLAWVYSDRVCGRTHASLTKVKIL